MKFSRDQLIEAGYREHEKGVWGPVQRGRPPALPNVEPDPRPPAGEAHEAQEKDQKRVLISDRVRIEVVSHRSRFCDCDNLASKWLIDSLVAAKVIADDNPKFVESVTFRQEKCKRSEERTILETYRA